MSFTKNEAVVLTLIAVALFGFGQVTEGLMSYVVSCIGGFLLGCVVTAEQAAANDVHTTNQSE